ncbi:uncharacterized protein IWZ02DRAFT_456090 [Phyllosticta citriasiana]|uniref:uncharacterized protein n=1 Tax=Phyllosticta citriasiana TaxID=595635 RepID=UPI0030FD91B9
MAGFIQGMIQNKIQDVAQGVAMYAVTTGGRVVGDVVISAGDLIESSGRSVGDGIEGYIDRYGNWIRSYGNGVTTATAASDPPNGSRPVFQTKPFPTKDFPTKALQALPASNKANVKALPAPGPKKGADKRTRPQQKRSNSDTKAIESSPPKKGLPSSGVKKAIPAPRTATNAAQGLSKGQLAKLRGIKLNEEKEKKNNAGPVAALPAPANGGATSKPTATRTPRKAVGGDAAGKANVKPASNAAKSVAGDTKAAVKGAGGEANKENAQPTTSKPMYIANNNSNNNKSPVPFSTRTPDGKVKISSASRPKKATANLTNGIAAGAKQGAGAVGGAAKAGTGAVNKGAGAAKGGYDFLAERGGPPKSENGGVDFMKMYTPPSKKGAGSVAGSVKGANGGGKASSNKGGEKRAESLKFDFF